MKNFVFKGGRYFYTIFYFVALLNPIGSSLILYILNSFVLKSLLLGKFVSDVIVSLLSFSIINLLNKINNYLLIFDSNIVIFLVNFVIRELTSSNLFSVIIIVKKIVTKPK